MLTIDAQVHAYERNHPGRPWLGTLHGPAEVTGDQMVAAMDAVGVDGAVLVSPFSMYGFDASYALQVYATHPRWFGLVKPVDPTDAKVADTIAQWAATAGTVGIRIMLNRASQDPADPGINRILTSAAQHSLPVNLLAWGRLEQARQLAARHPNTMLVIDHLGLQQPFEPPVPAQPFAELPKLLALAPHDNVALKVSGACTLSHEPFPIQGYMGPACSHLRCVRLRSLPLGHRLDARRRLVDLRAGRRGIPRYRSSVGRRAHRSHGGNIGAGLRLVAVQSLTVRS